MIREAITPCALPGSASSLRLTWPFVFAIAAAGMSLALAMKSADALIAVMVLAAGVALWAVNLRLALAYGLIALFSKSFLMRLAFHVDWSAGRAAGGWLAPAPALFLAVLCAYALVRMAYASRRIEWNRPALWMLAFAGFVALTMLLPLESMRVRLGGLERNIFPTMAMALAGWWAYRRTEHALALARALMVFGMVSVGYALWQHHVGLPVWERTWFEVLNAATPTGLSGWLTVGTSGLEFRIHSFYYSYTEFFFTTVGILLLNAALFRHERSRGWRRAFLLFVMLVAWLLLVTLERMPIVMLLCGGSAMWAVSGGRAVMKARIVKSVVVICAVWLLALISLGAYLHSSVDKLARLAELTNPFAANSIQDRMSNQWAMTLGAIAERPWGWGLGSGSQTQASAEAQRGGVYVQPHNEILQKALELGLAGGFLFLGLLVSLWRFVARRLLDFHDPPGRRNLLLGYFGMMVALYLCGMVNLTLSGTMGTLFWTVTGLTWSLTQRDTQAS